MLFFLYFSFKADDTSLSGIEIYQVALLSNRWQLQSDQSTIPGAEVYGFLFNQVIEFIYVFFRRSTSSARKSHWCAIGYPWS